jgi:hypothetical protein
MFENSTEKRLKHPKTSIAVRFPYGNLTIGIRILCTERNCVHNSSLAWLVQYNLDTQKGPVHRQQQKQQQHETIGHLKRTTPTHRIPAN